MRILYLHQHFATRSGTTGTRSYEFAARWIRSGHEVTMVTGHYDVGGLPSPKRWISRSQIDGINVVVLGVPYSHKKGSVSRILAFLAFTLAATFYCLLCQRPDVMFATSTPLTIAIPAIVARTFRRVPYVFEVRDQWPAVPIALGLLRNRMLIFVARRLERVAYRHASGIIALSPGMASGIRRVLGPAANTQIHVATNCSDLDVFGYDHAASEALPHVSDSDALVLVHFGALGIVNAPDFILDAASRLRSFSDIRFLLIGDGRLRPRVEARIRKESLANVSLLPAIPKSELSRFLRTCDVSLMTVANCAILEDNSANKFFDSLAAGLPVILNYSGWMREALELHDAGFGTKQFDLDEFVEAILRFHAEPASIRRMGRNARRLAESEFNRDLISARVLAVLIACVEREGSIS